MKAPKILTIGGGTGQFALLSGLRNLPDIEITAVVSMADSGGSTGRLRDELGILPPGDILKCILALSPHHETARNLLLKKFTSDRRLLGHNAGNMLLTMLSRYTGSFPAGIQALAEILDTRGRILPVTIDKVTLVAELTGGTRIYGETAIDMPRGTQREKIRDVYLVPHHGDSISVYPPVIDAIKTADFILLGPGDLFTSIIPNLIVPGVKEALQVTKAPVYYIINIMTKFGETHHFAGVDFVEQLESSMGNSVDGIIYNSSRPPAAILQKYLEQKAEFVMVNPDNPRWKRRDIQKADLIDTSGGVVRHDSQKLAAFIQTILSTKLPYCPGK